MGFIVNGSIGISGQVNWAVLPVQNITKGIGYSTISSAVAAASAGDTIEVSAGTYQEELFLDKPITLRGPNYNKAGNDPTRVAEATITMPATSLQYNIMLYGYSDNITIEGFNLVYPDSYVSSGNNIGNIWYSSPYNNTTIRNNRMYSSEVPIYIYYPDASKTGLLIEGNYIDCGPYVNSSFGRAMYIRGPGGFIQDNVIVNANTGIQVSNWNFPGTVTVRRNRVQCGLYALYNNAQRRDSGAVTWQQNEVTLAPNDRLGLKTQVSGPWTNAVNFGGIVCRYMNEGPTGSATASFSNNTISLAKTPGVTYNSTVLRAVWLFADVPATATVSGSNNSLTDWTVAALNAGAVAANFANNWWGTSNAATVSAAITNTGGGSVNITPILTSGTDSQPGTIGFQP